MPTQHTIHAHAQQCMMTSGLMALLWSHRKLTMDAQGSKSGFPSGVHYLRALALQRHEDEGSWLRNITALRDK